MMKNYLLSFFLFTVGPFSGYAQTVSSQKGLTTAVFNLTAGTIKIYLPDDMMPGDIISGTIKVEPTGTNAKQIERNLAELKKHTIDFNGQKIPVSNAGDHIQFNINNEILTQRPLVLLNDIGAVAGQANIQCPQNKQPGPLTAGCKIPTHSLTAAPFRLTGSFDGNSSNTNCSLNSKPLQVLVESPRQCIIQYPANSNGVQTFQLQENGQQRCSQQVSGVNMEVFAGKLDLLKGERTFIEVNITGLQNLPDTAILTLVNISTDVVLMQPANNFLVLLIPDSLGTGIYNKKFNIQSLTTGTFTVNVNLDLPDMYSPGLPADVRPGYTRRSCECGAAVTVLKTSNGFKANPLPKCSGLFGVGINTFSICAVQTVSYSWSIKTGVENVELVGKTDAGSVTVKPKNNKGYTVCVTLTVICLDGSTCTTTTCVNQSGETVTKPPEPIPPKKPDVVDEPKIPTTVDSIPTITPKSCGPTVEVSSEPKLDGGLKTVQIGLTNDNDMRRDEFIALEAEGGDWDQLIFKCTPGPDCPDSKSEKILPLVGRVSFEWKIEGDDKGTFVKLGCLPDDRSAEGERVIFKPPFIPLPFNTDDTTVVTTITLSIIDDGSAADDGRLEKKIRIETKRSRSKPDYYHIEISGGEGSAPMAPPEIIKSGSCNTTGPTWTAKNDLTNPVVILPEVPDKNKMVLGQWIILSTANQSDSDDATFVCVSKAGCTTGPIIKSYPDKVNYTWEIAAGGGKFVVGNTGRFVVYQAPLEMPKDKEFFEVKFIITARNPAGDRKDLEKKQEEKVLKVYRPGVRLSQPDLTWLPKEDNDLEFKSELMYMEGGKWMPSLAHMCRIHYFELINVSNEKGVCLNDPVYKTALDCRDLKLKDENEHEAFDDKNPSGNCKAKGLYLQARTKKPEKEYSLKVYSLDFGSYGFLRSFANINKQTRIEGKPEYVSIPVKKTDVKHPKTRPKKKEYEDNRVTIPLDVDENHIADNGWITQGGVKMSDPETNNEDEDDKPGGDKFKGDGLSAYEEYRGFKVLKAGAIEQIRTNYQVKDIFVRIEGDLNINLYRSVSALEVHEISEDQYNGDDERFINFNNNRTTNVVPQRGLHLIEGGSSGSLLGIAISLTGEPTIPNWQKEIWVYTTALQTAVNLINKGVATRDQLSYSTKLGQVVAHELLHGNNVCHHGEGDPDNMKTFNNKNGLRSGNVDCVMRYDNVGDRILPIPEKPGKSLCASAAGTGYNENKKNYKDADKKRGNCKGQIRISAKGSLPKSCGNR